MDTTKQLDAICDYIHFAKRMCGGMRTNTSINRKKQQYFQLISNTLSNYLMDGIIYKKDLKRIFNRGITIMKMYENKKTEMEYLICCDEIKNDYNFISSVYQSSK
jgi:nitrogenase subunit NifH